MQKQKLFSEKLFPLGLMFLIDVLLTGMSFILSYVLCSMIVPDIINHRMLIQLPVVVALTSLIFLSIGIYKGVVKYDRIREVYSIFNAICLANILTIILVVINGKLVMEEDFMVPLSIIIVHSILSFSALVASRFLYKRLIIALKKKLRPTAKVLFVHDFDAQSEELDSYMEAFKENEYSNVFQNNSNIKDQKKKLSEPELKELGIQKVYLNIRPHETEKLWASVPKYLHLNKSLHLVFKRDKTKTAVSNNEDFVFTPLRKEYLFPNMLDTSSLKKDFVSNYKNKTVLITGAGGLIGRELVKQLLGFGSQTRIILVDNSEAALRGTMAILDDDSKQHVVPKLTDVKERDSLKKISKVSLVVLS
ncbi:MAG: polysaccharide biosynthesis protein [Bacteroidota bacterium]